MKGMTAMTMIEIFLELRKRKYCITSAVNNLKAFSFLNYYYFPQAVC